MSEVSLVKTSDGIMEYKKSIKTAIDKINFFGDEKIKNIVIKPNLCYYWDYSTGNTTDPQFVSAVIDCIRDLYKSDVKISIISCPICFN